MFKLGRNLQTANTAADKTARYYSETLVIPTFEINLKNSNAYTIQRDNFPHCVVGPLCSPIVQEFYSIYLEVPNKVISWRT